ncbi:malonate decarboxylase holo-[acyl-carrier-protein] synthase [Acetobacter conturbans]|uniref:Malonate decarboxylase holo-[acyl-carrier-protein] synthase n=1 Tax=Acetobacter conturbans TaxID=1737472 RepID=A0ABX0K4L1_9PROT|nr:malonate decarboxylase holo-[acyl-carrier-protein] synthase [Acetobacter conturbans]NHN89751.1 malonate decarboxylase holo-[acyl-carrier-protein] synthase [Acetobacter conturbans]
MPTLRRHALFTVLPASWTVMAGHYPEHEVRSWVEKGRPLICRRPLPHEVSGTAPGVPLGLPLPPCMGKQRLSFLAPQHTVRSFPVSPDLSAHQTCTGLSDARKKDITLLLALGHRHHIAPQVTGSLFWQSMTHLPYLSENSDLDLLWHVDPRKHDVIALLHDLAKAENSLSMRLDGEIIFPNDRAVQWRELHHALKRRDNAPLLVKSLVGLELIAPSSLMPVSEKTHAA